MGEFYDIYPKDRWRDEGYNLLDKFSLKGKKGFVTGGAGGIGRNTAAVWAEAGADVCLVDIPVAEDRMKELCEELTARYKVKVSYACCDVSDVKQVEALKPELIEKLDTVDIAHINAGVCLPGDNSDVSYENWKKTIDINLTGAHLTAQVAQQIMREHEHGGSIIFTSSLSGYNANFIAGGPTPVCSYGTTKAAVSQLARYMGADLAKYDIRCNSISPGYVWSGIHEGAMSRIGHDMLLEAVPIKRFGRNDELQGAILFLSSDASSYITGINIPVDGGYSIF